MKDLNRKFNTPQTARHFPNNSIYIESIKINFPLIFEKKRIRGRGVFSPILEPAGELNTASSFFKRERLVLPNLTKNKNKNWQENQPKPYS